MSQRQDPRGRVAELVDNTEESADEGVAVLEIWLPGLIAPKHYCQTPIGRFAKQAIAS